MSKRHQIQELYDRGVSRTEISKQLNVSYPYVHSVTKQQPAPSMSNLTATTLEERMDAILAQQQQLTTTIERLTASIDALNEDLHDNAQHLILQDMQNKYRRIQRRAMADYEHQQRITPTDPRILPPDWSLTTTMVKDLLVRGESLEAIAELLLISVEEAYEYVLLTQQP